MWKRWPVQVWWMKWGTQSQCTATTQRDGAGRDVGGVFTVGNAGTPMADSCQCMVKNHHNIVKQLPSYWNKKQTKNFSCGTVGKESACDVGFLGLIPGWGRSPEEGIDNSLQCSCLENCMYRAACWTIYMGYIAHGVSKSLRQLSDFLSLFHFSWIKLSKIVKPQVIAYADI